MTPDDFAALSLEAGAVFSPSAPIDQWKLFAGRTPQLEEIVDAVNTRGRHAIVFGERGVGKTSLANIVGPLLASTKISDAVAVRENCFSNDTFATVWRRALQDVQVTLTKHKMGFSRETVTELSDLSNGLPEHFGPDAVVSLLRRINARIVFIFDEFDQLPRGPARQAFSETIKSLSDFAVPSTILIVGIGDDVSSLLDAHASVERAVVQIRMPRMAPKELEEIIVKATAKLGVEFDPIVSRRIVAMSQGLPHYVHLLGLYSTREALAGRTKKIQNENLASGIRSAVEKADQSVIDAYLKAVTSPQKDTLFKEVLLACALAPADELGYFAAADIRDPIRQVTHRDLDIPAFARHLNQFSSSDRGHVLEKSGTNRKFRYRFRNPLMQPFVIMRGIADQLLTQEDVDGILKSFSQP